MTRIAFVGLGEAGGAIVDGWGAARAGDICAYDRKLDDPETAGEITARAAALGIAAVPGLAQAVSSAKLVFSAVTADQAVAVAEAAAPHLAEGTLYFDLNSCAPSSKARAAAAIEGAGARYVDVAVMSPIFPKQNLSPLLISGPHAAAAEGVLAALPMAPTVVEGPVGRASSIKMIRSIFVKGMEALTAECTLAAEAAGVSDAVLPSLLSLHPRIDVEAHATYNFERMLVHGVRRAAEMDEVAITVADLGLPNGMSAATAAWERAVVETGVPVPNEAPRLQEYTVPLAAALRGRGD